MAQKTTTKGKIMSNQPRRELAQLIAGGLKVEATSATQVAEQANLDWNVSLADLNASIIDSNGVTTLPVVDKFATVKTTKDGTHSVIGTVGSRYKVFQNSELFSVLDILADSGDARYAMAGEIKNGSQVYMMMELPDTISIQGDPHAAYLLARTSHDGSCALGIAPIVNRLRCTNQISGIFKSTKTFNLRHTSRAELKPQVIREYLKLVYDDLDFYRELANDLYRKTVQPGDINRVLKQVFPLDPSIETYKIWQLSPGEKRMRTKAEEARSQVRYIYNGGTGTQQELHGTAYGIYQALVEYSDHYSHKKSDVRADRILTGKSELFKRNALRTVRQMIK